MIKCVDLFSGCGGFTLGFQNAGFEVLAAFDNWEPAINVYKKNFSHPIINFDLTNEDDAVKEISKYDPDLILGGPPCQDFSSAGKRDITLGRADLTIHFSNIICALRPEWFVMENVEQIKNSFILKEILSQFNNVGYGLSAVILNASFCGVPQARERFFLVGHFGDKHNQLNEIFSSRLSREPMTLKDYFGKSLGTQFYYRHPRNYNRRGVFSIDEPSPTVRGVNRPIPPGYRFSNCDPEGIGISDIRPLTTLERSYIQTFPKSFLFEGTKTNLELMIGNAVPVELAKFVAETINIYNLKGNMKQAMLLELEEIFKIPIRALHLTDSSKEISL